MWATTTACTGCRHHGDLVALRRLAAPLPIVRGPTPVGDAVDGAIAATEAGAQEPLQVNVRLRSGKQAVLALPPGFDDSDALSLIEVIGRIRDQLRQQARAADPASRIILPSR